MVSGPKPLLLTGATGFVGAHLYPALIAAGHEVRCASREPRKAAAAFPDRDWVELDAERPATLEAAMKGCSGAFYLIHGMTQGGDYPQREASGATNFARAAARSGIERIVYLGGVLPTDGRASKHLASRQRTGELLRQTDVVAIELRAAMIIGAGSASWMMLRDLAARLPAMLLPRWLRNHSHPVAIDDVVWALIEAMTRAADESRIFELPGPERLSHRELLDRVAAVLGHKRLMVNVPVLTPRLSSYWIALVTRVDLDLAKELVEGVRFNLDPSEPLLWPLADREPMRLEAAAKIALADATSDAMPSPRATERSRRIGLAFKS